MHNNRNETEPILSHNSHYESKYKTQDPTKVKHTNRVKSIDNYIQKLQHENPVGPKITHQPLQQDNHHNIYVMEKSASSTKQGSFKFEAANDDLPS